MSDYTSNSLTDNILEELRQKINESAFLPGAFITEGQVSSEFKVSKTPAREALGILCQEGLLTKMPRRGYVVTTFSPEDILNLIRFRQTLEMGTIRYATRLASKEELEKLDSMARWRSSTDSSLFSAEYSKLNLDFHLEIARMSRNPYLLSSLENTIIKLRSSLILRGLDQPEEVLEVHTRIVQAMKLRDEELACRIQFEDLEKCIARI